MSERSLFSRNRYLPSVAAALLVTALTACSHTETAHAHPDSNQRIVPKALHSPGAKSLQCVKIEQNKSWGPAPGGINVDAIAHFLSVTPSQITNGEMGPVHCNGSLTVVDIEAHAPGTAVEVRGTIGPCLTVGLTKAPEPRKRYTDLLVICPGPVEEPSVGA